MKREHHPSCPRLGCRAALLLCLVASGAFSADAQVEAASIDELYHRAWNAYHQDYDPDEALALAQALTEREDLVPEERIRALLLQAICQVARGHDSKARETIEEVLSLDPEYQLDVSRVPPKLWRIYYNSLKDKGRLKFADGIQTLAVLDLRNNSVTEREAMEALGQGLADALIGTLAGATNMRLVERERIDFVRREIGQQQTDAYDLQTAVRVGRLLGAQSLLIGGFCRIKDRIRIDIRVVQTETGEILKTRSTEGEMDELSELLRSLARDACEDLEAVYRRPADPRDTSFGAFLEYSQGLALLRQDRTSEALSYFQRAVNLDGDFAAARVRVQQLAP